MWYALRHLGLDMPHEAVGRHGAVSWMYAVPSSSYPFGARHVPYRWSQIFHQTREPLATIASLTTISPEAWAFAGKYVSLPGASITNRAARLWLDWNLLIERFASWRYRIEDVDPVEIAHRASLNVVPADSAPVPQNANHRPHAILQWRSIHDAILRRECQQLGESYGYKIVADF